jgi:hypothetical protein
MPYLGRAMSNFWFKHMFPFPTRKFILLRLPKQEQFNTQQLKLKKMARFSVAKIIGEFV